MQCLICGKDNPDSAKFCGACGGELATSAAIVPSVPEPKTAARTIAMPAQVTASAGSWGGAVKIGLLLTGLTALLLWIGSVVGGMTGILIALGIALVINVGSFWFSDRLVLMATGAREVTPEEAPQLHQIVEALAARAEIPKPRVCVVEEISPNAFATGRDPQHGVVAVTTGLLAIVDRDNLEGVLAHELAHIKHRDTLLSAVVAALVTAIMFLGYLVRWGVMIFADDRKADLVTWLALGVLAPLGAVLVQLGISRAREYKADEAGAYLCGKPLALADALQRLESSVQVQPLQVQPATAHLFIVAPSPMGFIANLFRTHPTTASRVERLQAMMR